MAEAFSPAELAWLVEDRAGVAPLLTLTDHTAGSALVLAPSTDGRRLVLGTVDSDGGSTALTLEPDAAEALADALVRWLDAR